MMRIKIKIIKIKIWIKALTTNLMRAAKLTMLRPNKNFRKETRMAKKIK